MTSAELAHINFIFSDEEIEKHCREINDFGNVNSVHSMDVVNSTGQLSFFDAE